MNFIGIAVFLSAIIVPFAAFAQPAKSERRGAAKKAAQAGFYFNLTTTDAKNARAGWQDETLALFRSRSIPAFDGDYQPYKAILLEPFVPLKSLKIVCGRRLKDVWVGPFETEETAIAALEKFASILSSAAPPNRNEQAQLQFEAKSARWSIGAIKIFGHEAEKPTSFEEGVAADKEWAAFWTAFRAAAQKRDRAAMRSLMRFSIQFPGEIISASAAFERLDDGTEMLWGKIEESLATGARVDENLSYHKPSRLTGDERLIFEYGGKWRWRGFLRD